MFWLIFQMWILLTFAFIMGISSGWWIFKPRTQEAYHRAPVYDEYDDYINQRNQRVGDEQEDLNRDIAPVRSELPQNIAPVAAHQPIVNAEPENVIREKIYEKDLDIHEATTTARSDNLNDLPDMRVDTAVHSTEPATTNPRQISPELYATPINGAADDLKKIKGIGTTLENTLNSIGIHHFRQIASWSDEQINWIDNQIDFPGRVRREKWVAQAQQLSYTQMSPLDKGLAADLATTLRQAPKAEEQPTTHEGDYITNANDINSLLKEQDRPDTRHKNESITTSHITASHNDKEETLLVPSGSVKSVNEINSSQQDYRNSVKRNNSFNNAPKDVKTQTSVDTIRATQQSDDKNGFPESVLDKLKSKNRK